MSMLRRFLSAGGLEDKEKKIFKGDDVKAQFKALISYYKELKAEERKAWNNELKNYRKAFGLCRSALDEFSRVRATGTRAPNWSDVKHPCQVLLCLQYLSEDNPELLASKRNLHAWTDLIKKFLDNRTHPTIRLEGLKLLFIIVDGTRERCPREYLHLLRHAPGLMCFCVKGRFEKYLRNFKSDMIVAHDPLPWTRHGKVAKAHCLEMIVSLMNLSMLSSHFDFWYSYFVEHIYPQLYHLCAFENSALVFEEFGTDSMAEFRTTDVEMYGFGSSVPPEKLQRLVAGFLVRILDERDKAKVACKSELRLRYLLEIGRRTMALSMEHADLYFKLFRNCEKWSLGVDLSPKWNERFQQYWQYVFSNIYSEVLNDLNVPATHIKTKARIASFTIYLYRIQLTEPYCDWTPETWRIIAQTLMAAVKNACVSECKSELMIKRVIYPLVYCYLKCLAHCSLVQPMVANDMFEEFAAEINTWLGFRPFVVVWREFVRNLTLGLLHMLKKENTAKRRDTMDATDSEADDDSSDEKSPLEAPTLGGEALSSSGSHASAASSPGASTRKKRKGKYRSELGARRMTALPVALLPSSYGNFEVEVFHVEPRVLALKKSTAIAEDIEYESTTQAFMVWDRFLHLIGNPNHNRNDHTRNVHLEGIADCLKLLKAAMALLPITASKLLKAELAAKSAKKISGGGEDLEYRSGSDIGSSLGSKKARSRVQEYGMDFCLIEKRLRNDLFISQIEEPSVRKMFPLPPRQVLPQGDTLAFIFCPYLFDTCFDVIRGKISSQISRCHEFETAFSGLCHVLLTMTSASFDEDVLAHFYDIIRSSFDSGKVSQKIRAVVVRCCAEHCLFGNPKMIGVNVLIPHFMNLICAVFSVDEDPDTGLRRTDYSLTALALSNRECIDLLTICCTLVCFASHFDSVAINLKKSSASTATMSSPKMRPTPSPKWGASGSSSATRTPRKCSLIGKPRFYMREIKPIILMVFKAVSVVSDAKGEAVQLAVWGLTTIIFDEVTSTRNAKVIEIACRCLADCASVRFLNCAPYAVRSIEMLSVICDQLVAIDESLVTKMLLNPLLKNLDEFVRLCTSGDTVARHRTVATVGSEMIYALIEWVFRFPPHFLADTNLMGSIIKSLGNLLIHSEKTLLTVETVATNYLAKMMFAAKTAMLCLYNYLCNFPLSHDVGAIHTNATELNACSSGKVEDILKTHLFGVYHNSCLFSCSDQPVCHFDTLSHGVRIVSRDDSGKFLWQCSPCSLGAGPPRYSDMTSPFVRMQSEIGRDSRTKRSLLGGASGDGVEQLPEGRSRRMAAVAPLSADESSTIMEDGSLETPLLSSTTPPPSMVPIRVSDMSLDEIRDVQSSAKRRVTALKRHKHIGVDLTSKPEFVMDFENTDALATVLSYVDQNLEGVGPSATPPSPPMTDSVTATGTRFDSGESLTGGRTPKRGAPKKMSILTKTITLESTKTSRLPDGMLTEAMSRELSAALSAHTAAEKALRDSVLESHYSEGRSPDSGPLSADVPTPVSPVIMAPSRTSPANSLSGGGLSGVEDEPRRFSVGIEEDPRGDFEEEIRHKSFTPYDATRSLLTHLGLLTAGPVLRLQGDSSLSCFKALQSAGIPIFEHRKMRRAATGAQRYRGAVACSRSELGCDDPHHDACTCVPLRVAVTTTAGDGGAKVRATVKTRTRSDADMKKVSVLSWGKLAAYFSMVDSASLSVLEGRYAALDRRIVPLDQSSFPREKHKIGLVYVGASQENQREILKNTGGSPSYEKFVCDLGAMVDLSVHEGFRGGLGPDSTGRFATYCSTVSYEMVFHIPTRMPTRLEDPQQTEKKRHVGNDHVNIIWSDHFREYLCATISSSFNNVHIVVYPLPSGMYRIRIHKKKGVASFGPLVDNMLVREPLLSLMVRLTALEANRVVRYATPGYTKPFVERRKYLDEAIGKLFTKDGGAILSAFFPGLPSE